MLKLLRCFVRHRYWFVAGCGLVIGWALYRPATPMVELDRSPPVDTAVGLQELRAEELAPPRPLQTAGAIALCQYDDEDRFVSVPIEDASREAALPHTLDPPAAAPGPFPFADDAGFVPLVHDAAEDSPSELAPVSPGDDVGAPSTRELVALTPTIQIYQLTDHQTGVPVATLKLSQRVREDRLASREPRPTTDAGIVKGSSLPVRSDGSAGHLEPYRPFLEIRGSRPEAAVIVDARNVELAALVRGFAHHFELPIEVQVDLVGTLSAQVHAANAPAALQSILQSVGLSLEIREDRAWRVVRGATGVTNTDSWLAGAKGTTPATDDVFNRQVDVADSADIARVSFVTAAEVSPRAFPEVTQSVEIPGRPDDPLIAPAAELTRTPEAVMSHVDKVIRQAEASVAAGDVDAAIDLLAAAICENSHEIRLVQQLARIYLAKGDNASALAAAEECLAWDRHQPDSNAVMGDILGAMGQDTRAQHYRDQARFLRANRR